MKLTMLLLPILVSKVLLSPVNENENQIKDSELAINLCINTQYNTTRLNATELKNYLESLFPDSDATSKTLSKHLIRSVDFNKRCALTISKNLTTQLISFNYGLISKTKCYHENDKNIICNTDSNCTDTIKCCDKTQPICGNAFGIKQTAIKNIGTCSSGDNTKCFSLYQLPPRNNQDSINMKTNLQLIQLIYFVIPWLFVTI